MKSLILAAILIFISLSANAEPFGFKQFTLGSDISKFKGTHGMTCGDSTNKLVADQTCTTRNGTLAGIDVDMISLGFYNKKLSTIIVKYKESGMSSTIDAVKHKYGLPKEIVEDSVEGPNVLWGIDNMYLVRLNANYLVFSYLNDKEFLRRETITNAAKLKDL